MDSVRKPSVLFAYYTYTQQTRAGQGCDQG
jgi:hypothetical protein